VSYFISNGVSLYYEKIGQGKTSIIFLHGNGESSKIYINIANKLKLTHTVYLLDSRDHGKSGKCKILNYSDMAEDVLNLIKTEKINKPIIYGFSDGGIIAILCAIKDSISISKIIVSGINLTPKGLKKPWLVLFKIQYLLTRDRKIKLMLKQPQIKQKDLLKINVPIIILYAANDMVRIEDSKELLNNTKNSQLVIVPHEKHHTYVLDNDKLLNIISQFIFV